MFTHQNSEVVKTSIVDYEAPESDFIDLDTGSLDVDECVKIVLETSPVPSKS